MKENRTGVPWKFVCFILVAALIGAGILLAFRPDLRYLIKTVLLPTKASVALVPVEEGELTLERVSLASLEENPKVTWEQSMMLINQEHRLDQDFVADTGFYEDSEVILNRCMIQAYGDLSQEVRTRFEVPLLIKSAYRTMAEQAEEQVEEGENAAQTGASEHQAGLALDVCVPGFGGRSFLKTGAGQFVNSNSWEYGFIIRYPWYGQKETGIPYEPWHLRYVGKPHAEIIMLNHMTLESYVEGLEIGTFYRCGDCFITRQNPQSLQLPGTFSSAVVSPDNTGALVVTLR